MTSRQLYRIKQIITCVFLVGVLAWLTVSLPFVYNAQQTHNAKMAAATGQDEESGSDNPLTNTTEEKTSSNSNSFSEEYIHETHFTEHFLTGLPNEYKIEHVATYTAFYGELISPPPDLA